MSRRIALAAALTALLALPAAARAADPDPVEGQPVTRSLAVFDPPVPAQVTIDWGDGKTELGVPLVRPDGKGEVTGTHTYAKLGGYQIKVADKANANNYQTLNLRVVDAPITAAGTSFTVATAPGGVVVATIADGNALGVPESLKADIDWGDGSPTTPGTITQVPGQTARYQVSGSHTYPDGAVLPRRRGDPQRRRG